MKNNEKLHLVVLVTAVVISLLVLVPSETLGKPQKTTETQVTTSGTAENPEIYGNTLVWQDTRNGGSDIYTYDIPTKKEKRITKSGSAVDPAIYGKVIVWSDGRNENGGDIYMYDLSAKKETRITTSGYSFAPDIYDSKLVYQRSNWYQDSGIFLYDLSTKKVTQIDADSLTSDEDSYTTITNTNPVIYGNRIAWEETFYSDTMGASTENEGPEIYDLSTKTGSSLGTYGSLFSLDIYKNMIISKRFNDQLWMYDFSTKSETLITISEGASNPRIYGNKIALGNSMYDLSTNSETLITTSGSASNPAIHKNRIVWQDSRNGGSDIYMSTIKNHRH